MNEQLKLSYQGARLIQHFEGCLKPDGNLFRAYKCPAGVLTIGWGTTNEGENHFDSATRWTADECHAAFLRDMESFEKSVRKLVTTELNQHQYDSLVSFCYNCGAGALKSSTLLKCVNRRDFKQAAQEFKKWTKGGGKTLPGLVRRRNSESLLFQGIPDNDYDGKPDKPMPPMPQQVDNPEEMQA